MIALTNGTIVFGCEGVYVLEVAEPDWEVPTVKIGVTLNIDARFKAIQACSPLRLGVRSFRVCWNRYWEMDLHHLFRDLRLHGEWFDVSDPLVLGMLDHVMERAGKRDSLNILAAAGEYYDLIKSLDQAS